MGFLLWGFEYVLEMIRSWDGGLDDKRGEKGGICIRGG